MPQFIEVEDKIFGPFTLKQFIYLAGGAGIVALLLFTLPLIVAILLSIPVAGLAGALAFYRMNNKPFIEVLFKLDPDRILSLASAMFQPMDLLFLAIAVYEGYKLSFRYRLKKHAA